MTLTTEVSKVVLAGNGLTRDWDYTFPVFDNANYLKVYLTDPDGLTYLIEENYTVDLINSFVTYPTVISGLPLLPSGWKITIARELPEIQTSNYTTDGKFAAKAIENNLDKLTAMVQQQSEEIDRCVKVSIDNIGSGDQSDYLNKIIEARDETEVFRDEAEFFKDEAETAKTNAETAKTNAETAETNAETAETNAEGYANDALYYLNTATGISDWIDTKTYTKNMMCMHNDVVYYALDVAGNLNKEPPNITYWVSNYPVVLNDLEIKNLLISKPDSHFKYIDVDFQVGERYRSVWGDGTFVYVTCFGDGLRSYSVDGVGNLTYIDVDFQAGNDYSGVWGDGNFIYVACGFSGLRSYSYSYNTPDGTVRFDPTLEKLQLVVDNAWDNIITNRALLDEGYSRSYNYFDNGAMEINQRAVEYAFLKNVWAFPVDRWDCMAIGTTVVSGTLKQINSTMGNLGKSIKFENLTITGAGEEYLRERIAGQYAIALKNKKVSIQCKIKHDIGNAIDFTIYLRKATSYNDFTIVTNITNSGAISVPSDVETLIKFENIDLGDCSNGLEFELKCESGEITNKNFEFTEFKLEIGEKITPFVAKDYASEILNCQKYYERVLVSFAGRSASLYSGNDRAMGGNINYSSTKIKIPYLYENEDYLDRIVYYGGGIANWTPGNIDDFNVNVIKNNLTGFIWERTGSGTSLYEHVKIDFEMIADSEYTLE